MSIVARRLHGFREIDVGNRDRREASNRMDGRGRWEVQRKVDAMEPKNRTLSRRELTVAGAVMTGCLVAIVLLAVGG